MKKEHVYFWLIPFLIISTDIVFRFKTICAFTIKEGSFYVLSIALSLGIYKGLHFFLNSLGRLKIKYIYLLSLFITGLFYTFLLVINYGYYNEMSIMPNYYVFDFIKDEPLNSWIIFRDSFMWYHGLLIIMFSLGLSFILYNSTKQGSMAYALPWPAKIIHLVLVIVLLLVFNNNVRFVDQCFVADVNTISFALRHINNHFSHESFGSSGLLARNRILLTQKHKQPDYNVLLIIAESLRRKNMQVYGYRRATTPFFTFFAENHPEEFLIFKNSFSNSTTSLISYPSILTGVSPVQSAAMFHSYPLFWEYAKTMDYFTFLISSHPHDWYNFKSYFSTPAIDYKWNKEISGLPVYNNVGIRDDKTVECFINHINNYFGNAASQNKSTKDKFAGVLHLNTTHYPYNAPREHLKWEGARLDQYDNTILYQDLLIKSVFNCLEKNNLLQNTIIFFTSDHGEGFKEHGWIGHRDSYYIEVMATPFILYIPENYQELFNMKMLKNNTISSISNLDLIPTAIDIFGINHDPQINNLLNKMQGSSLFSAIPVQRNIYLSNTNEIARYKIGLSLVKGNMHYILQVNTVPQKQELYNFINDPDETEDLWKNLSLEGKKLYHSPFKPYKICMDIFHQWNVDFFGE
ncbi:MAG: sulfatase-like hydrolase/transferase [bacterium]